jgi:hypothetical protein
MGSKHDLDDLERHPERHEHAGGQERKDDAPADAEPLARVPGASTAPLAMMSGWKIVQVCHPRFAGHFDNSTSRSHGDRVPT